jgi:hypothetical protein
MTPESPPPSSFTSALGPQELISLAVIGVVYIAFALILALQASRRGYSLLVWLMASLAGNMILLLVMLGVLPDFARKRLRKTEMEDLESRLKRKAAGAPPGTPAPAADVQRSLGDQVTALPERSLGDVETRL